MLSILLPSYNYQEYLPEAVDSILMQEYTNYEIVLVDDCSTDESPMIAERYARMYPQIRYIRHTRNQGLFATLLTALHASQGEFIHYFSADDMYLPGFLSHCMQFFACYPQASVVCTDLRYFQVAGQKTTQLLQGQREPIFFPHTALMALFRTTHFWVTGASCIAKRSIVERHGPHDPQLENLSDWYLFHKIALHEGIGYIPLPLTAMRVHDRTLTSVVKRDKQRQRATYHRLLHILLSDKELRSRFVESGLLDFIFRDLRWRIYSNPRYAPYWFC